VQKLNPAHLNNVYEVNGQSSALCAGSYESNSESLLQNA
jgi:hypothetical protein